MVVHSMFAIVIFIFGYLTGNHGPAMQSTMILQTVVISLSFLITFEINRRPMVGNGTKLVTNEKVYSIARWSVLVLLVTLLSLDIYHTVATVRFPGFKWNGDKILASWIVLSFIFHVLAIVGKFYVLCMIRLELMVDIDIIRYLD